MIANLAKKWLEVQKEIKPIEKDSQNPHFKSWYFDINKLLADIKPILSKHGLIVMQPFIVCEGRPAIQTTVIDAESAEEHTSTLIMPENSDPQKMGSIISYYRRHALTSLFALEGEDDDAESAKPTPKAPTTTKPAGTPIKAVQQPTGLGNCDKCGSGMTAGKDGRKPYCVPCYKAWKNGQAVPTIQVEGHQPAANAPRDEELPPIEFDEPLPF